MPRSAKVQIETAPCTPTGPMADPGIDPATCRNGHPLTCRWCGVALRLEWQPGLRDWAQVDAAGSQYGRVKPPHGENGYEYSAWLRERAAAGDMRAAGAYSMSIVVLDMFGDPFTHRHLAHGGPGCGVAGCTPTPRRPDEVPYCHDWPMQLVSEGWQCRDRSGGVLVPFAREDV